MASGQRPKRRRVSVPPATPESAILAACLEYLTYHPAVAFAFRMNSGGMKATYKGRNRYIPFNTMPGVSDILGMLKDGRFLAVECKRAGNKPTTDQRSFLDAVTKDGGLAIVAYSVEDIARALNN